MVKLSSIDLFSGAGGMAEGFKEFGFEPVFANDIEKPALETFCLNHPNALTSHHPIESIGISDLRTKLKIKKGGLDVLIGGPPCQGFSTYGQRDPNDPRNQLYNYFLDFLKEFRPKAYVIENVIGILSMQKGQIISDIKRKIEKIGYGVNIITLNSAEYGVPQIRKRVFIYGGESNSILGLPQQSHSFNPIGIEDTNNKQINLFSDFYSDSLKPVNTVRDAISDLPLNAFPPKKTHEKMEYPIIKNLSPYQKKMRKGSSTITHHSSKQMLGIRKLRLTLMKQGDYGRKIQGRLLEDGLSDDMISELLYNGNGMRELSECRREDREKEIELREILSKGHIDINDVINSIDSKGFSNKYRRLSWDGPSHTLVAHMARDCSDFIHPEFDRFITVREAARLQSFPDGYYFKGSQFRQLRQIGNAVPPMLAGAIAKEVRKFLV